MPGPAHRTGLQAQIITIVLAVYFYFFMEWLFFATKPSFLAAMDVRQRLAVLLITPLPIAVAGSIVTAVPWLLGVLVGPAPGRALLRRIGWAAPAAVLACGAVILIDNFTYTVFKVGIVSTAGLGRSAYAALVVGLFLLAWRMVARAKRPRPALARLAAGLLVLSLACAVWRYAAATRSLETPRTAGNAPQKLPNIVLLATDGLEARHMSAYGYRRDTTPTIKRMLSEMLVCENAFHNGGHTAASNASLLTGRLPLDTGLLYEGRVLQGIDAYKHLPGMLKRLGYHSMHIGIRPYSDPFAWNMRDSFEVANGRRVLGLMQAQLPALRNPALGIAYSSELYFLEEIRWRITDRLQHLAGIEAMVNPYLEVQKQTAFWLDNYRLAETFEFIRKSPRPFFVHAHLMGTHPPLYPRKRVFSRPEEWDAIDAYDDAVLDFDTYVAEIVEMLTRESLLGDTVLVIMSDHGKRWRHTRLPLMFRFPEGKYRGIVKANAQLLDVAPTLLDYLGVPIPAWMQGRSLLTSEVDPAHPIFSMRVKLRNKKWSLASVAVTFCNRTYRLDVRTGRMTQYEIKRHTTPCDGRQAPTPAEAKHLLVEQLQRCGFGSAGAVPGKRPST